MNLRLALASLFLFASAGCPSPPTPTDAASDAFDGALPDVVTDAPVDTTTTLQHTLAEGCDPLVPTHCGFPFPSDTWLVSDPTAPRGRRVIFGPLSLPLARNGVRTAPDALRLSDGFSPAGYLLTHMPGATVTGLADANHIERSLEADSPTVLIEADTGVRVAHFAEIDAHSNSNASRAFMIRPATRLHDATRYIVAIRNVVDSTGAALAPTDAFRALRDNGPFPADPSIEARRARYETMFNTLATAGVPRAPLQMVWDFTTASRENNTEGMLAMRDAALASVPAGGPHYVIDTVQQDVNANIAVRIEGRITVPLYLDIPGPGGRSTLDARGIPMQNGTAEYPFVVIVPQLARTRGPLPVILAGHGLFGNRYVVDTDLWSGATQQFGYVMIAMDYLGMADQDPPVLAAALQGGDLAQFATVPDRGRQAFVNMLLAVRMMSGDFANEPMLQFNGHSAIDTTQHYYLGGSQGGIYGASLMALSTDIQRGVLLVPGEAYSVMLPRSVLYDQFEVILNSIVTSRLDAPYILDLAQMLWDRTEPSGYSPYITSNPLPGTPAHQILMVGAIGDHEVPNVATHELARTMHLGLLQPAVRPVYGLDPVASPFTGSAYFEEDWGLPPVPVGDLPMEMGEDPHGHVFDPMPVQIMIDAYLRTGTVTNACTGTCDPG